MSPLFYYEVPKAGNARYRSIGGMWLMPMVSCQSYKEWAIRLMHESSCWPNSVFITLTYSDEFLPGNYGLNKAHFQKFVKRLRKRVAELKYFGCGEYGELKGRPHYHAIVYGEVTEEDILAAWSFGRVYVGSVTHDSCNYVAGYIQKKLTGKKSVDVYGRRQAPFALMSQGLGLAWAEVNAQRLMYSPVLHRKGIPQALPRYYRKKLPEMGVLIDQDRLIYESIKRRTEFISRILDANAGDMLAAGDALVRLRNQWDEEIRSKQSMKSRDPDKIRGLAADSTSEARQVADYVTLE